MTNPDGCATGESRRSEVADVNVGVADRLGEVGEADASPGVHVSLRLEGLRILILSFSDEDAGLAALEAGFDAIPATRLDLVRTELDAPHAATAKFHQGMAQPAHAEPGSGLGEVGILRQIDVADDLTVTELRLRPKRGACLA